MAKITLSSGFTMMPKGEHTMKITGTKYDEDFGVMEVSMVNQDGFKHTETFRFLIGNGEVNQVAMDIFSTMCKNALNDFSIEEIEPNDIVGCFFTCEVDHRKSISKKNGKEYTNVVLNHFSPSAGFEEVKPKKTLASILG